MNEPVEPALSSRIDAELSKLTAAQRTIAERLLVAYVKTLVDLAQD